ncbi:MAG: ABC transporter ATP-binding protein, partial [Actinomycetota bacterium]|nr:ABC transporter ATP-binding protein [Actinomycetota bacterium]
MTVDVALAVEVVDLSRVFTGPPEVAALAPCSFTIAAGDFVAITGPSGSGKTTLLSLLGLLDQPSSGSYRLDGVDVADLSDGERAAVRAHRIGFVFQAFHLIPYRTVTDNIELGLTYQGIRRRQRRMRALEVIDQVGLASRRDALCAHLSGGEKQRVAIARTLIREPALVLCDEPTGNLDTASSEQVLDLVGELHRAGLTVVIVTHDSDVASRASRNLVMRDG